MILVSVAVGILGAFGILYFNKTITVPLQVEKTMKKTESGIWYEIITAASEDAPKPKVGQKATVHYTGWLSDDAKPGKKCDSSVDRGTPFTFTVGFGQVIKGWDESVLDMQVGETRRVILPADMAYGSRGAGSIIPPHAELIFDISLLKI